MSKIAFDVDGTLIKFGRNYPDVPRYEVIELLRLFKKFGHEIYVWSDGGVQYAKHWTEKLGLDSDVKVVEKWSIDVDLAIDDEPEQALGILTLNV